MKYFLLIQMLFFFSITYAQTPGAGVTDIDGNSYSSVIIGNQEWMVTNLKVGSFSNGDPITNLTDGTAWGGSTSPAWCNYDNSSVNDSIYGKLYNWYVIDDSRNVCPTNWHVPSIDEWDTLVLFEGGNLVAGGKLKEMGLQHWSSPNTGATNQSGFTALPGGYRSNGSGNFSTINDYGYWWSSTPQNATSSLIYYFHYNNETASLAGGNNQDGQSVRCVTTAPSIGIIEIDKSEKELLQIVDLMGRETETKPNMVLIYIYSDGSTERIFKMD